MKAPETVRFVVDAAFVTARLVVVALPCTKRLPVVVAQPSTVRPPTRVPLPIVVEASARMPLVNLRVVVVASPGNGYEKLAQVCVETRPALSMVRHGLDPDESAEIRKLVVEARVEVIIVVDANGMESPVPAGAEKLTVSAVPPTNAPAVPENEMAVPAIGDDVATD